MGWDSGWIGGQMLPPYSLLQEPHRALSKWIIGSEDLHTSALHFQTQRNAVSQTEPDAASNKVYHWRC